MISQNEIKEKGRVYGVPLSTIERDYAQNWLLMALSSFPLVLKGGTGIRKVYIGDYRFSDDLDFTLLDKMNNDELDVLIEKALEKAKEKSGINFSKNKGVKDVTNGFELNVYFQLMQKGENKTAIRMDITKHESEKILLPINIKKIIHPYSDDLSAEVKVYTLEELIAEKIRSLFQRTRPRDLYDVWYLWDKVYRKKVFEILPKKFMAKNVEINIRDIEQRKDNFKNAWESSLSHQISRLLDFEEVFSSTFEKIENILKE